MDLESEFGNDTSRIVGERQRSNKFKGLLETAVEASACVHVGLVWSHFPVSTHVHTLTACIHTC